MKITDRKSITEAVLIACLTALGTGIINLILDKFKDKEEKKKDEVSPIK